MNKRFMNRMIAIVFLILPLWANSQVLLKGNVKTNAAPQAWANVILTDQEGKVVTGALTKEDGTFEIRIKGGAYKIKVSFLGFTDWGKDILLEKDTDLGTILLKEKAGNLNEVVIVARKKLIAYKTDRLVFNVENSITAIGGSAVSAISAAPGVMVQNNAISILGKGASRVMIDGRIIELSGQDLINYLSSIAASDILNIEIITNPPAKYEAAGDGGLININLKKGARNSWKNATTLSYDQSAYNFFTLRNNFFYNKNKVRFSFNAGGRSGYIKTREDLTTYYPGGPWELKSEGKQKEDNISGAIAFDYDVSDNTTIGVQYAGNYDNPDRVDHTSIKIRNANNIIDSLLTNTGVNDLNTGNHTYNAHMISKLDTLGRKISFDLDYFTYDSKTDNRFVAETFLANMKYLNTNQAARNVSTQDIGNVSVKVDMEHPLKFLNLSYGIKVSSISSKGNVQYYNTITGTPVLDPGRSNRFEYKENNQAIYVNGTKDINNTISLQLGLRLENTGTQGYSRTLGKTNTNNYLKLFPTLYFSYKKNENNTFLFNYGRRINRPGFRNLNPFRSYINSNSYSEGNPFLQPSFNDNFDFTHIYKEKLRTNVFFNVTTNGFGVVFTSNPITNTQIISRQNYFKEYYYGIGENYATDITPWWQSQNSLYLLGSKSVFVNHINATPKNNIQLYLSTNNTFSLSKSTKLQVDYFYSSPLKRGLYELAAQSGLNIGLKQSLLKNNLQLSLLLNDIFNTAYLRDYTSVVNGIKQVYGQNNSSRFVRLSLIYNLGNNKINVKKRNFGNDDERKRTE
ncbi:outer membrane receptor protein involved in Fe transport [Chitinophaga niastensis]|uniref:Outer membrane receptor protein involved in Fe transport n=1 Tax=Chitinophaga niastensis TaxID=536980 RepID=A0A2P8HUT2_CHINA|nr:outer membrane beta-barrel family protein [Chitinophaga niastensis]PSL49990.1 outer membrane receptor protein involved in Fe transport [Chitinophaga niastensis]